MSVQSNLLRSAGKGLRTKPKPAHNERVITRLWNRPQTDFLMSTARFVDFEGAVRAGKSTPLVWKLINYAVEYPGIRMMLSRWTQDALDAVLKPLFYDECPKELLGRHAGSSDQTAANGWNSKEEYQEFRNGSRLYIRALKTSDDTARYTKFAGLTLGVVGVDQPEELPEDVFVALKARLSQHGFPQQMLLTPNPPAPDHWLVKEFPIDNILKNHEYICTSVYDNRKWIGDDYIEELEREYPAGHVLRRRFIEGKRGLSIVGDPVYKQVFSRSLHIQELEFLPDYPLIESWDFGQRHPAVSWHQLTDWGWWNILGLWQGSNQFIDDAINEVAMMRSQLFEQINVLRVCCDPAGATHQGHGIKLTAVDVLDRHLREMYGPTVGAQFIDGSNRPEKREWAIQTISGYLSRLVRGRPALLLHPRCGLLIDGFEAGYVYDSRQYSQAAYPNIRRPKKDGYYDHSMNTVEYCALNFAQRAIEPTRSDRPENDYDEMDEVPVTRRNRAGY